MSDEITVKVHSYGPNRPLSLVYIDPISGKKIAKSAKTREWREAERLAGELEKELRAGRFVSPSKITWDEFQQRLKAEKLAGLSKSGRDSCLSALNHVKRVLNPDRLCKLTSATVSKMVAKLREEGMKDTTLCTHLRHLRAALSWAKRMGMLAEIPVIDFPRPGKAKGRSILGEEFDRMIDAASKVRPDDTPVWQRYITALWLSGLRLEESLILSWDEDAPFSVNLQGRRPSFHIKAEAQKARRDEVLPMTPDFAQWLLTTPEAERVGPVFKLTDVRNGQPLTKHQVGQNVGFIGHTAGVVVATVEKRKKVDGKLTTVTVRKFATAHDLRRSFGTRWAKRVMPAVLQRLMRHASINTTMRYYVTLDADEVADGLWAKWGEDSGNNLPSGNTSGNTSATATTEPPVFAGENGGQAPRTP
jgi:integrase